MQQHSHIQTKTNSKTLVNQVAILNTRRRLFKYIHQLIQSTSDFLFLQHVSLLFGNNMIPITKCIFHIVIGFRILEYYLAFTAYRSYHYCQGVLPYFTRGIVVGDHMM